MKLIFAGTPDFAVPSLRALAGLRPAHEVVAVVTQPDRPKGRSGAPAPPPVKTAALELGLPSERILQPKFINRRAVMETLRGLAPDLLCVVAYGGLLRRAALVLPRLYCLNAHASLLPRFRGAAPIQAALLAGDELTGVTIFKIEEALDTGPVLLQREVPILPEDTAESLHDKLAHLSAVCFLDALRLIESGQAHFGPQDASQATYVPKLTKDSGALEWTRDARYLERFVRAMSPWPGAWTTIAAPDGSARKRIRIAAAALPRAQEEQPPREPGRAWVVPAPPNVPGGHGTCLAVACGSGVLNVLDVQPEGGRVMGVAEFLRGAGRAYAGGALLG